MCFFCSIVWGGGGSNCTKTQTGMSWEHSGWEGIRAFVFALNSGHFSSGGKEIQSELWAFQEGFIRSLVVAMVQVVSLLRVFQREPKGCLNYLVDVSDIFYFFSARGGGRGSPRHLGNFLGGGRLNIIFWARNVHQDYGGPESDLFRSPCFRNPCFRNPCLRNPCFRNSCLRNPWLLNPWLWRSLSRGESQCGVFPTFGIPVFGVPDFGILGFGNLWLRNPWFRNSHLRNFSRIQAPLNQTPLRLPRAKSWNEKMTEKWPEMAPKSPENGIGGHSSIFAIFGPSFHFWPRVIFFLSAIFFPSFGFYLICCSISGCPTRNLKARNSNQTAKSTHHPHKIDDQHRKCKIGGGAYFAFLLGSDNSHTTPQKLPRDEEGLLFRRTQEGCGCLGGANPAAFPQARPIFQQPFSLPESAQTFAGIAFGACRKIGEEFSSSVEICRKTFPAGNFGQPQPSRVFWFMGILRGSRSPTRNLLSERHWHDCILFGGSVCQLLRNLGHYCHMAGRSVIFDFSRVAHVRSWHKPWGPKAH